VSYLKNCLLAGVLAAAASPVLAHSIQGESNPNVEPAFDITFAEASTDGRLATFVMEVTGEIGSRLPAVTGQLTGAKVDAYVWPTKLDPENVGFAAGSGILALAITAHPDFDDTPLFDENGDGNPSNDGAGWHSHWVVLGEEARCGAGLKVRDVSPGVDVLPDTAPGLPLALDSPGMTPLMAGNRVNITMPLANAGFAEFDAVTAELQVNEQGEAPLLCVIGVRKVLSGDLSFPGKIHPRGE